MLAKRLKLATRHLCCDLEERHEAPRREHSNPDLAAAALRMALDEAQLKIADLGYMISHPTRPARLLPPNASLVADRVGFEGPYMELLQACTGIANALVIAQGLVSTSGGQIVRAIRNVLIKGEAASVVMSEMLPVALFALAATALALLAYRHHLD